MKFIKNMENQYFNANTISSLQVEKNQIVAYYPFHIPPNDIEDWAFNVIEIYADEEEAKKELDRITFELVFNTCRIVETLEKGEDQ